MPIGQFDGGWFFTDVRSSQETLGLSIAEANYDSLPGFTPLTYDFECGLL